MGPPHFLGNNLISIRVIDIFFEQLHIAFCLAILLLKKSLPIVLVPGSIWLIVEISHRSFFYRRFSVAAKLFSCSVLRRSWPQAASISCPFSLRIVASTPARRSVL